jgi:hypothetical protein
MKGLEESTFPGYLIGFPAGCQEQVQTLVERETRLYSQECAEYAKKGERHPVGEDAMRDFINLTINTLRREIRDKRVESFSAPRLFSALSCIAEDDSPFDKG